MTEQDAMAAVRKISQQVMDLCNANNGNQRILDALLKADAALCSIKDPTQ